MAIINNISTEIGDVMRIKTTVPVIGVVALTSFVDSTEGEDENKYFNKYFRYSVDGGINFTTWYDLTTVNISNINITNKSQFVIDCYYERAGTDSTGDLSFLNFNLSGDFEEIPYPKFNNSFFSQFFGINDIEVLNWALNVLEKVYDKGIIPEYIARKWDEINPLSSDADYLVFWNTITHFYAIIVNYARQYLHITDNKLLSRKFLEQLGLYLNSNISDTHLTYLFENYSQEFRNRGTMAISTIRNSSSIPNGELIRLINYQNPNEFIFALLEQEALGWNLGKSSPISNQTRCCKNLVKGYEQEYGFTSINNYPISDSSNCSVDDQGRLLITSNSVSNIITGIYPQDLDLAIIDEFKIKVDSSQAYEIIVSVSVGTASDTILSMGVLGFSGDQLNSISLQRAYDEAATDLFFEDKWLYRSFQSYVIRAIIYPNSFIGSIYGLDSNSKLNIGFGYDLKFNNVGITSYILPILYVKSNGNAGRDVYVNDFKIRPLNFNFTQGKFGLSRVLYSVFQNNSRYSDSDLSRKVKNELIPYNCNFIDNVI